MSTDSRLSRSGGQMFLGTAVGQVANLTLLALVAHQTSIAEFGLLLAAIAVVAIAGGVVDFGLATKFVRDSKTGGIEAASLAQYMSSRAIIALLSGIVFAGGGLILGGGVGSALAALAPWFALRVISLARLAILQSRLNFKAAALAQVADRTTALIAGALLLGLGAPPLLSLSSAYAAGAAMSLCYAQWSDPERGMIARPSLRTALRSYREAAAFGVTSVVTDLVSFDLALVAALANSYQAGLFALPSRVAGPATTFASSLAAVALATLSAEPNARHAWQILVRGSRNAVALVAVVLTVGGTFAKQVVVTFGGAGYVEAVAAFRFFLLASAFATLNQLMLAYLQSRKQELFAARVLVLAVLLSLACVAVGATAAGATGASMGYLLANVVIFGLFSLRIRSILDEAGEIRDTEQV